MLCVLQMIRCLLVIGMLLLIFEVPISAVCSLLEGVSLLHEENENESIEIVETDE